MSSVSNCDTCNCASKPTNQSVCQTVSEMDWERGIWNAALNGEKDRVAALIKKSKSPESSVNEPDNSGYTALHYASRNGHLDICTFLLQNGAKVNAQTRTGKATPLHKAAAGGKTEAVKLLIKHGADVTSQDDDGETALHKAVYNKHINVAKALIDVCPDLTHIKDKKGTEPIIEK